MTEKIQKAIDKIDGEAEKLDNVNARLIASHIIDTYLNSDENADKVLDDKHTMKGCFNSIISKAKKQAEESKKAEIKKATAEANEKANKKIDKLIQEKTVADEKLKEALKSAKAANADEDVTAIRFLFNNLQSTANEIQEHLNKIAQKDKEQADKLSAVMLKVLTTISTNFKGE